MFDAVAILCRLSLLLVLLAGCDERPVSALVSGRVTLNGEPQEGIFIYFTPDLPPGADRLKGLAPSYARTDKEGKFSMEFMALDNKNDVDMDIGVDEEVDIEPHTVSGKVLPGALATSHTVTADDERTFANGGMEPDEMGGMRPRRSRVPSGWTARIEVPPEGTTEVVFELNTP